MASNPDIESLSERIRATLSRPLSQIGEAALVSFLALPGVAGWHPQNLGLLELSYVFDVGLPFALLGKNPSAEAHKKRVADALKLGNNLPASDWSEVQAGAILSSLGKRVSFVKRQSSPTPDLEVQLDNGVTVDLEVTRAEIRPLHAAALDRLESFAGALLPGDVNWNLVFFFADASNPGELNAAFDAVIALRPGEYKEASRRWFVRAVPLVDRDDVVGLEMQRLFGPDWWPSNEPSFIVNSTLIGGSSSPVVALRSLIPVTSYMNPLRQKADSGQRRPGHPYLIALDTEEMLGAHQRIARELDTYLSTRDHVSGVMLFDARFWVGSGRKEWVVSIHTNPHARISLPADLTVIADGQPHSVQFELSS